MARKPSPAPRTTRSAPTPAAPRLSISEAAARRGVCDKTIRRYIAQGVLPAYRVGPRLIRIDPVDLDRLSRRIPTVGGSDAA